jgi:FixJ family two-component response regulator
MPRMSGLELPATLKEERCNLPIIKNERLTFRLR